MSLGVRARLRNAMPRYVLQFYRFLRDFRDIPALLGFLVDRQVPVSFATRLGLLRRMYVISANVDCPHTQEDVLSFMREILVLPDDRPGCVVEAGCFKGGSTAKFSLAARLAGRELVIFDSFEGIPANVEEHGSDIFGRPAGFAQGSFRGGLEEVRVNVARYGATETCRFIAGWFDDSMPGFDEPVAAVYLDVDLVASTRTCLKQLYPLIAPGGAVYSQDGHLPLVLALFDDETFWRDELGVNKPPIHGFGKRKVIHFRKR